MLKKVLKIVKKVVLSVALIYGYSLIASPLNAAIPLNLITVSFVTILGLPALLSLIIIAIVFF